MKIPFNPLRYRYHSLRPWLAQPAFWALFFLGPAFDVFRVDVLAQHLVFFGRTYPFETATLMWLPIGFYGGVLLVALATAFYGRVFCGWACPHNTLTEWTVPLRAAVGLEEKPPWMKRLLRALPGLRWPLALLSPVLGVGLTFVLSLCLSGYLVAPAQVLAGYATGTIHPALVLGQALFSLIGLFLLYCGHHFCRNACPYGMAQAMSAYQSGKWRPMEIVFTADRDADCGTCTGCRQVCPVDIDPRLTGPTGVLRVGQFDGCFNCGACIDACKTVQTHRARPGFLRFAMPWQRRSQPVSP